MIMQTLACLLASEKGVQMFLLIGCNVPSDHKMSCLLGRRQIWKVSHRPVGLPPKKEGDWQKVGVFFVFI